MWSARNLALTALRVVGAMVAAVAMVIGLGLSVLRTDWGGERLRRQVVAGVNRQIHGSLAIKRLAFEGDRVVVWGVDLRAPDGRVVAQLARAEVDVSVIGLLHKEIRLTALAIEAPRVSLVSDDQGLNLARATAPRETEPKPPPPKPAGAGQGWVVRLDRFDLTDGDLTLTVVKAARPETTVHLSDLLAFASVRYATGNGSLDLSLRLNGQSQLAPVGPLRLSSQVSIRGSTYRFDVDGVLLGGTVKARGSVDADHLENADVLVALAIPRHELAAHPWGPLRVDAKARPGSALGLDAFLAIPGLELGAKNHGPGRFGVAGRLTVADLGLATRAAAALIGADLPPIDGLGWVDFNVGAAAADPGVAIGGDITGTFDRLRVGETLVSRLTIKGQIARLSKRPESAFLDLGAASVSVGKTQLRGLALSARVRDHDLSATVGLAGPARIDVSLAGRFDDDEKGFALGDLLIALPGGRWNSQGTALLRFDAGALSLQRFRLVSDTQVLAVDGDRRGEEIAAHVSLNGLRLGRLPTTMIDPSLHLDGELDADIKVAGKTQAPNVIARVELRQGRYQGFSGIDAQVGATLHEQRVDGTVAVQAPVLAARAEFAVPTEPLAPGAPINLRLDVKHLDLAEISRAARKARLASGRVNLKLRLDGSADRPNADLTMEAFDLAMRRPGKAAIKGPRSIDLGHARIHLRYAERAARAEVDFASSHGGTLQVDAGAHIDLSLPGISREKIVVAKLPVHGKVVARKLNVAWIAPFNPRLESLDGQVSVDARLAGTLGDPQFIGEIHWKDGAVVATVPSAR